MNPPTQPTYAAHLREACKQPASQTHQSEQLKLLDTLIRKAIEAMSDNSCKLKISDALAAIKLREKVAKNSDAEQIFWQMIDDIKQEQPLELDSETPSLEDQIQDTILGLKPQVENGALPIKIITDTFNQGRSKESQFTYRRVGELLSGMGFRKARTHVGSYAILWDDNLLFQPVTNSEESEGESLPVRPAAPEGPVRVTPAGGGRNCPTIDCGKNEEQHLSSTRRFPCCPTLNPQKNEK